MISRANPASNFTVRCESRRRSAVADQTSHFSIYIGQLLRSHGVEQSWDTVIVHCDEDSDGALTARVVVSNPDWSERLEVASLRSRPRDEDALSALVCNLEHRSLSLLD